MEATSSPDIRLADDGKAPTGEAAVRAAAAGKVKDRETADAALDWLLSDEPDETGETLPLELNIGSAREGQEKWITWMIQPVDGEVIRRIRRQSTSGRAARRAGQQGGDDDQANRRIVVAGTAAPNVVEAANQRGLADPASLIELKFRRKPGLVQQLVVEILSLSGYDDDDVREVQAAKN
jgi:hypothetical protein